MLLELPQSLLLPFVLLVGILALRAPLHWLLILDLMLVTYPGDWEVSKVHLDFTDVILGGLVAGILLRGDERRRVFSWRRPHTVRSLFATIAVPVAATLALVTLRLATGKTLADIDIVHVVFVAAGSVLGVEALRWRIPYLPIWLGILACFAMAYITADVNAQFFEGPTSIAYQVYRYCWRILLYYPLVTLLIRDRRQMEALLLAVIAAGTACAVMAFGQGWAGDEARGPFITKNVLGGALCLPFILSLGAALGEERPARRYAYALSALLMARGLLFAGSRGAFVAVFVGSALLFLGLRRVPGVRRRALKLAVVGIFLTATAFALQPGLLERPNIQHLFTTARGTQDENMRWRIEQRWPHFWRKILQNPVLGIGTDIDYSLGDSAVTPHNGYLGLAIVTGLPGTILFVALAALGFVNGWRTFAHNRERWQRIAGLAIALSIFTFLLHNMVDQTFKLPFAQKVLWIFVVFATALAQRAKVFLPAARKAERKSVPAPAALATEPGR
jgi:O-antigen ligase